MKELDVVRLIKEFEGLPIGTKGTIVCEYDGIAVGKVDNTDLV